jgi:uncharacterized membrane protein YfcA
MENLTIIASLEFWLLASIGVILTGISKSGFAGGAGVVAVPLLALIMPIAQATAIILPVLIIMDIRTVSYYWPHRKTTVLKKILPAAIVGIIVAGLMMGRLNDNLLQLILGIASLVFAFWGSLSVSLKRLSQKTYLWSSLSGFSSTLIHSGGPPINIYFAHSKLDKLSWLATASLFFGALNLIKIAPYTLNNQWDLSILLTSLLLIPIALLGVYLGKQLQQKFSDKTFTLSCKLLLGISGILLLIKAFLSFKI